MSVKPVRFRQHGASVVELAIAAPVMIVLGLGTVQSGLLYHANTTINYATFEAARKGAVLHAQREPMLQELSLRLAPLFGGDGSSLGAGKALATAAIEVKDPRFTRLEIINPSREAFQDWAAYNPENGVTEIPNSHLRHRNRERAVKPASGVNLQDANLLKIKVTYGYEMKVPIVGKMISRSMLGFDPGNALYYLSNRLPISAVATVRMQSPARPDNNNSTIALNTDGNTGLLTSVSAFTPEEGVPCDAHGLRSDIDSQSLDLLLQEHSPDSNCSTGSTINSLLNASLSASPESSPLGAAELQQTVADCVPAE